jgi:hypothetical protein
MVLSLAAGDALAEGLDQLVRLVPRHVLHHLVDALVVDGLPDAVAAASRPQVALDLDVEQHGPAHAALGRRHAQRCRDLDAFQEDAIDHTHSVARLDGVAPSLDLRSTPRREPRPGRPKG